jgi:hypothetical protein
LVRKRDGTLIDVTTNGYRRIRSSANVAKYLKILATYLTPHEREFVEQRLAEERAGLEQLCFTGGESDRKLAC